MFLAANVTLFRLTFTKTATFLEKGMTRSFIMTVPIITLRSNRKMELKSMEKQRTQTQPIIQMGLFMDGDGIPLAFYN